MLLENQQIAFLVGPGFEDLEFWVVYMRLVEEGARVTTVGVKAGEKHAGKSGGLFAIADVAASDVTPDQFDAIVIPGGWAPDKIRRYAAITDLVKGIYDQGKILGSSPATAPPARWASRTTWSTPAQPGWIRPLSATATWSGAGSSKTFRRSTASWFGRWQNET